MRACFRSTKCARLSLPKYDESVSSLRARALINLADDGTVCTLGRFYLRRTPNPSHARPTRAQPFETVGRPTRSPRSPLSPLSPRCRRGSAGLVRRRPSARLSARRLVRLDAKLGHFRLTLQLFWQLIWPCFKVDETSKLTHCAEACRLLPVAVCFRFRFRRVESTLRPFHMVSLQPPESRLQTMADESVVGPRVSRASSLPVSGVVRLMLRLRTV